MGIESLLASIDTEISRLEEARKLLSGGGSGVGNGVAKKLGRKPGPQKRHNLTPEGRAKIAAAVKARWERQKASKKK